MPSYTTQNSTIGNCSLTSNDSSTDSGVDNDMTYGEPNMNTTLDVKAFGGTVHLDGSLSVKEAIDKIIEQLDIDYDVATIKKENFFAIAIEFGGLQLQLAADNKLAESGEQMLNLFNTKKVLAQCLNKCGGEQTNPEVSFKLCRNGFLSIKSEKKITNCKLLKFLYLEAKEKVEKNIYPLSPEKRLELRVIEQFLKSIDSSNSEPCKRNSIYDIVEKVYGEINYKNTLRKRTLKFKMLRYAKKEEDKFNVEPQKCGREELYHQYLAICHEIKSYGGFVFEGQMERSIMESILHLQYEDKKVYVSVNEQGFHIINKECPKEMLNVPLQELYYSLYTPEKTKHFPCLYFKNAESNLQQVFSHHAYFIDKVLKKLINDRKDLCKVV